MSLNASEQQALDFIEATLTSSDPKFASARYICRLASGEEMPVRERVWIHLRSGFQSLGWSQGHAQKAPGRIGRATCPAGTSCLEGVGRQGRGETEHTSGIDARLATLATLVTAGQASWCSGED
jgi:hypothetical protein